MPHIGSTTSAPGCEYSAMIRRARSGSILPRVEGRVGQVAAGALVGRADLCAGPDAQGDRLGLGDVGGRGGTKGCHGLAHGHRLRRRLRISEPPPRRDERLGFRSCAGHTWGRASIRGVRSGVGVAPVRADTPPECWQAAQLGRGENARHAVTASLGSFGRLERRGHQGASQGHARGRAGAELGHARGTRGARQGQTRPCLPLPLRCPWSAPARCLDAAPDPPVKELPWLCATLRPPHWTSWRRPSIYLLLGPTRSPSTAPPSGAACPPGRSRWTNCARSCCIPPPASPPVTPPSPSWLVAPKPTAGRGRSGWPGCCCRAFAGWPAIWPVSSPAIPPTSMPRY